jgi:hypothetical protein
MGDKLDIFSMKLIRLDKFMKDNFIIMKNPVSDEYIKLIIKSDQKIIAPKFTIDNDKLLEPLSLSRIEIECFINDTLPTEIKSTLFDINKLIQSTEFEVIDISEQGIFVLHEDSNITFRLRVNRNDLSVYLKLNAGNVSYFIMIYPLVNKEFDYDRYLIHLDLINKINNL